MRRVLNLTGGGFAKNYTKIGQSDVSNHLGMPYFMDVSIDNYRLQNEPLITIVRQKRIVETVITGSGRNGTVKEFISADDFKITIEGIITDPTKSGYPQAELEKLIKVLEKNASLDFNNELAALFGIYKVVVKNYGLGKDSGKKYSQSYKIDLVSDEDFYGVLNLRN